MSQENVEVVRQLNALFNAGEAHAAIDQVHREDERRKTNTRRGGSLRSTLGRPLARGCDRRGARRVSVG
jgi:hypothetical protein